MGFGAWFGTCTNEDVFQQPSVSLLGASLLLYLLNFRVRAPDMGEAFALCSIECQDGRR